MKNLIGLFFTIILLGCNGKRDKDLIQGKIERDQIAVVSKIPGRILQINVKEGDFVTKGDTLAILDIPEVSAKKDQAFGAVTSAEAQYNMAVKGATNNQIKQLNAKRDALKEQFEFAQKSLQRIENMLKDSLVPQQTYDETFAKYQGAKSQLIAVEAEIADAAKGARIEQQTMASGQVDRALGALKEVETAENERYIIAPQDMSIETITLKQGELALPGYTLFNGYLNNSVYFRFTLPEGELQKVYKGKNMELTVYYNNETVSGTISQIKQLSTYANIATAYPDYELQESLFEIKIVPDNIDSVRNLHTKATILAKF